MNPVIAAVDAGHISYHDKDVPTKCKKDGEKWPCKVIQQARRQHRANRGEK